MTIVASYFDINTGSAEREAESAAQSISRSFFQVSNLIGVTFYDTPGKTIKVPKNASRPADVTYFTFRSNVSAKTVDCRVPKKSLTLEFSLRLPQSLSSTTLTTVVIPPPVTTSPSVQTYFQPVVDLAFTLDNLSDDILSDTEPNQLRKLVINVRDTITSAISTPILSIAPSNLVSTPKSLFPQALPSSPTPKMNRVHSIALSGGVMTFTGTFNFLTHELVAIPFLVLN